MEPITRREFLKTAGKGLSLLAMLSGGITFSGPACSENKQSFANNLIHGEDQLKVIFLDKIQKEKSDAFLIMLLSASGLDITLHDGGYDDGHTYKALRSLRNEILEKAGVTGTDMNKYKLSIRLVISHFHTDHVQGLNGMILRNNRSFAISEVYAPPATCLPLGIYDDSENSDVVERKDFMGMMRFYHPDTPIRILDYGDTCILPTDIGEIRLFAPVSDWGTDEKIKMFSDVYGYKSRYNYLEAIPICAVNANSLFMRVSFQDYSFLFTGDIEKRKVSRTDEPLDEMVATWGEALRSDIIKYPHHGQLRKAAAKIIQKHLITDKEEAICILTASDGWEDAGVALKAVSLPWLDLENGSLFYTVKDGKMTYEVIDHAKTFL